jgi:diguanylate cyclase (GGDEF)-like protein/PAS domain S-box-containing protein
MEVPLSLFPPPPGSVPDPEVPAEHAVAVSPARAGAARATMEVLAASPDVFATFFEQARIGLALADLSGRYVRVNQTYAELVGREPEDLVGAALTAVLHPDDRSGDDAPARLLSGREPALQTEERYLHAEGRVRWVLHGVTVVPGPDGRPAWFAVSAQDITERRRAEQDLRDLAAVLSERAVRDPLTGLANRVLLEERLRAALARDARSGRGTGLLFLDLDGFKEVNDRHGHDAGDAVLQAVAGRLTAAVRPSDTVARLGGDEFVVLVEGAEPGDVDPLVARLRVAVRRPVQLPDVGSVTVGVSIGAAWCRRGECDAPALLRRADEAMYLDKGRLEHGRLGQS